ncbi:hypothetical protein M405DRAFT_813711 [Rhizopogon salebrosus TDB-379]|nr:hypothetical protein M405DRAFT_813711 [Rhizopogon salebrosus TDB-379]
MTTSRRISVFHRMILRLLVADAAGQLTLYSLVNSSNTIQLTAKCSLPALPSISFIGHIYLTGNQHDASFTPLLCSSWFHVSTRRSDFAFLLVLTPIEMVL